MVTFFPADYSAAAVVCRAGGALVPDVGLEGQSAAPPESGSTLSVSCAADLMALLLLGPQHAMVVARGRRLDAVHVQRQATVSALPHDLQHGGRSDHDAGDRRWPTLWLGGRSRRCTSASLAKAARRRDRDVFLRQHRPGGRRHRAVDAPERRGRSGTRIFSGADRASWSPAAAGAVGRGRDRARRSLDGHSDARAGVPDLSHLSGLPRHASKISGGTSKRRRRCTARRSRRCCRRAGPSGRSPTKRSASAVTLRSIGDGVIATDLDGHVLLDQQRRRDADRAGRRRRRSGSRSARSSRASIPTRGERLRTIRGDGGRGTPGSPASRAARCSWPAI